MPRRPIPGSLVSALEVASAALLAVLAVNAAFELFAWIIWHHSIAALDEIQAVLMVWFGMLSAAYCLARGSHLAVDIVIRHLRGLPARLVAAVPPLAVTLFGTLLAIYGWRLLGAIRNTLPATGWSAAVQYQPVAVLGALIAVIGLLQLAAAPPPLDAGETDSRPGPA